MRTLFVVSISGELKDRFSENIKSARFLGIMSDGATDVGTREVEDLLKMECLLTSLLV